MEQIKIINFFIFLSALATVFTITEAYHETLKAKIQNGQDITEFTWIRTEQYLANENLPIWSAWTNSEPELMPDIMIQVGHFVMYHDIEHCSAVVYFAKTNRVYGVIDTRYYIKGIPLEQIGPNIIHKVGEEYVKDRYANDNTEHFHDFDTELSDKPTDDDVLVMDVDVHPTKNVGCLSQDPSQNAVTPPKIEPPTDPEVEILYPEILLFVSNDIIDNLETKYPDSNLALIVCQYIIYFNAVDMLFARLLSDEKNIKLHLNIAAIVMEEESGVFPFTYSHGIHDHLNANKIVTQFPKYIKQYQDIFVEDSFDFFFISTKFDLYTMEMRLNGISRTGVQVFDTKSVRKPYVALLGSLVQHRNAIGDYIVASHEIAHLMGIFHDPQADNYDNPAPQCSNIMQQQGNYCQNCARWSGKSVGELKAYIRTNKNHCFLLNPPRSLYEYDKPMKTIEPLKQCICYGFDNYISEGRFENEVGLDGCTKQLKCGENNEPVTSLIPPPLDGTPCSTNKVCWQSACRSLIN